MRAGAGLGWRIATAVAFGATAALAVTLSRGVPLDAALMSAPAGGGEAGSGDIGPGEADSGDAGPGAAGPGEADDAQFALDNAIFTAVLDAANECLGRFDTRPPDDRWCDALLQVIYLAQLSAM